MLDAKLGAGRPEVARAERHTVVRQQSLHGDAQAGVGGHRIAQEQDRLRRLLAGCMALNASLAWSSMATNSVSQPAPSTGVFAIAGDAVAGSHDAPELLGMYVQQVAGGSC